MVSGAVTGCIERGASPGVAGGGALPSLRALLAVRGFVRLAAGNGIAQAGQRLQSIAIAWLVLEMTGSKLTLGLVVGGPAVAVIGASLLGGVLADSPHARRTLRVTRLAMAGAAVTAGLLVTAGHAEVGLLTAVVLVTAFSTAVDVPVGRTLIFDMAGRERLLSGTAMASMAMNLCTVVGPVAVGLLIGRFGVDAALYAIGGAYVVAAALIPSTQRHASAREVDPLQELREGFAYLRGTPCVAWLIGLFFLVPVAGVFFAMVPVYAHEVLDAGPSGLGLLMGAYGAGTVVGSGYLVVNGQMRQRGLRVTAAGVLFGAGVIAFGLSRSVLASTAIAFGIGVTAMLWLNTLSAMVQTAAAPEMKGRAMSVGTMGAQLSSLGWLVAGAVTTVAGPVATVVMAGGAFVGLSVFVYARSAEVRAVD